MTGNTNKAKLIQAYSDMAKHTAPECANNCRSPHSCCNANDCAMTAMFAKEDWGVDLKPTGHPTIPFMGPNGCVVEPHLRPLCTVHTCAISSFGFKPGDSAWTKQYFKLRNRIDVLHAKNRV